MTYSEMLYNARVAKGLTQKQLQKKTGISQQLISHHELGKQGHTLKVKTIYLLCSFLNIPIDSFVKAVYEQTK